MLFFITQLNTINSTGYHLHIYRLKYINLKQSLPNQFDEYKVFLEKMEAARVLPVTYNVASIHTTNDDSATSMIIFLCPQYIRTYRSPVGMARSSPYPSNVTPGTSRELVIEEQYVSAV